MATEKEIKEIKVRKSLENYCKYGERFWTKEKLFPAKHS